MLVIDASVIVSSFLKQERFHKQAKLFLSKALQKRMAVLLPEIVMPEIASAIARGTRVPEYAIEFCRKLRELPNFIFIPIDEALSQLSVEIASRYLLKGADSIYVAVAYQHNSGLATLDQDQKEKDSKIVEVVNVK